MGKRAQRAETNAWARGLCADVERSNSPTSRSQRCRQRQRALKNGHRAIPTVSRGRKPKLGAVGPETLRKRAYRLNLTASKALAKYVVQFRRLRVIVKTSLARCSDFRRMARLATRLSRAKASAFDVAVVLQYDRPLRDARLSVAMEGAFLAAKASCPLAMSSFDGNCTVLHCTVLCCTVIYCTVLYNYCIVLY